MRARPGKQQPAPSIGEMGQQEVGTVARRLAEYNRGTAESELRAERARKLSISFNHPTFIFPSRGGLSDYGYSPSQIDVMIDVILILRHSHI